MISTYKRNQRKAHLFDSVFKIIVNKQISVFRIKPTGFFFSANSAKYGALKLEDIQYNIMLK